ncbi:MAG: hypothetical protein ACFFB2_09405 [Promethearchaeota archaeon]
MAAIERSAWYKKMRSKGFKTRVAFFHEKTSMIPAFDPIRVFTLGSSW